MGICQRRGGSMAAAAAAAAVAITLASLFATGAASSSLGDQTYKYIRLDLFGDFGLSFADLEVYTPDGLANLQWVSATNPFSKGPYWSASATLDGDSGTCFSAAGTGPTASSDISGTIFSHKSSPSLVSGPAVPPDSHPYLVSLHAGATGHYCAGTLIAVDTVLTAASCAKDFVQSPELTLYVGRRSISSTASAEDKGVASNMSTIILHPQFSSLTLENDAAVVLLENSIAGVQPIQLDFTEYLDWRVEERWTTLGWGSPVLGSQQPMNASELVMDTVNSTVCAEKYGADLVPDTMMCASPISTAVYERCQGDIGGPLLRNSTQTQIGIMSWGFNCGNEQSRSNPSVFTRLSAIRTFLQPFLGVPPLALDVGTLGINVSDVAMELLSAGQQSASAVNLGGTEQMGYIVYRLEPASQLVGIRINNDGPCTPPGVFTSFNGGLQNISVFASNDGFLFAPALPSTSIPTGQWTQLGLFGRDSSFLLNGLPANVKSSFSTVFIGTSFAWQSRNIGYEFQANTELSVVGLGYGINVGSLNNPSAVGIDYTLKLWDATSEALLMTVVIPAGTELEGDSTIVKLVDNAQSVTLQTGSLYVVTVEDPGVIPNEFRFAKVDTDDVADSDYDQQLFTLIRGRHSNNLGPVFPTKVSKFVMGFPIIYFDINTMSSAEIARQLDKSSFKSVRLIKSAQDQAQEEAELESATSTISSSASPCDCDCDCKQIPADE